MSDVSVKNGRVYIDEGSYERETELDPAETRTLIADLTTAVVEAEQQAVAIVAACAEGHAWGEPYNGWTRGTGKVCIQHCKRPGCHAMQEQSGWMEFAGRLHIEPFTGQQLDCYGPGCEQCDMEGLGRSVRKMLAEGLSRMEAA